MYFICGLPPTSAASNRRTKRRLSQVPKRRAFMVPLWLSIMSTVLIPSDLAASSAASGCFGE